MFNSMTYAEGSAKVRNVLAKRGYLGVRIDKSIDGDWTISARLIPAPRVVLARGSSWREVFALAIA